ncbi:hypothetical protein BDF14DRAFT_1786180 [Spinellus fusiger]|nr:hypothetical protein BDF14DRAFT_1786180 [Spinellus fusiger]
MKPTDLIWYDYPSQVSKLSPLLTSSLSHTSTTTNTLDTLSRSHLRSLLDVWITHSQLTHAPWATVMMDMMLRLAETVFSHLAVSANSPSVLPSETHTLTLQIFATGAPHHSTFIPHVVLGEPIVSSLNMPPQCYSVSGTIRWCGVPQWASEKLTQMTAMAVFVLHSLLLEVSVMRDHHVPIPFPKITIAMETTDSSSPRPIPISEQQPSPKHRFWDWLISKKPKPTDKKHSLFSLHPRCSSQQPKEKEKEKVVHSSEYEKNSPLQRRLSVISFKKKSVPGLTDKEKTYGLLRKQLESALLSSSPSCLFKAPIPVSRLETEEQGLEAIRTLLRSTLATCTPQEKISFTKRASSFLLGKRESQGNATNLPVVLPPSIEAYSLLRIPESLRHQRLGLDHLMLETDTLDCFERHQQLTFTYTSYPVGCPDRPCIGPLMCRSNYFQYSSSSGTQGEGADRSLGHMLQVWCDKSQESCKTKVETLVQLHSNLAAVAAPHPKKLSSHSSSESLLEKNHPNKTIFNECNQSLIHHVMRFSHGHNRVDVYSSQEDALFFEDIPPQETRFYLWMSCNICNAVTAPQPMSLGTTHYSFAKYLELLFYSQRFKPPSWLCIHTQQKSAITRCFRKCGENGMTIKMAYEQTKVYDIRPSQIQVIPETPQKTSSPYASEQTLLEWKNQSEKDIENFFQALASYFSSIEDQHATYPCMHDVMSAEEESLKSILRKTNSDCLNDFRRQFASKTAEFIDHLNEWRHKFGVEQALVWNPPDYIQSKSIHCFPGSSVLVREDELCSIIAYTLSSPHYLEQLQYGPTVMPIGTPSTPSPNDIPVPHLWSTKATDANSSDASKVAQPTQDSGKSTIDGYYCTIERKYIAPSTGASTETPSFRTMVVESFKTGVDEARQSPGLSKLLSPTLWRKSQAKAHTPAATATASSYFFSPPSPSPPPPAAVNNLNINAHLDLGRNTGTTTGTDASTNIGSGTDQGTSTRQSHYILDTDSDRPEHTHKSSHHFPHLIYPPIMQVVDSPTHPIMSPHLKHKCIHESMEFTCIVYYAKEFERLRQLCGVDRLVVPSLSRCQAWSASGGKSKSHFYKTRDDRFIVKEMVNAWNIAERDSFLKFAPKYFAYMESTNAPSFLGRIFGFYSIEIQRNNKSLLTIDVLVMEHLFFRKTILKKFDFKGIHDRRLYEKDKAVDTLWDGDWIDAYRMRYPLHEQAWSLLKTSLEHDTEFLIKSNSMDYSLLVGIDESRQEIVVGIIDFIGTYTWYKMIESKSKSTLQPHKQVTILPPDQYTSRFCSHVLGSFVAIPDTFDWVESSQLLPSSLL